MKRPDVPDLGVADYLETRRMEDAAEVLVELVELVYLPLPPVVPEHPVAKDEVVSRVEAGPVEVILVRVLWLEQSDSFTGVDVVDRGNSVRPCPDHFVLGELGELDVLLVLELVPLVKELAGGPEFGEGGSPGGAGQHQPVVSARLNVADGALVDLVGCLLAYIKGTVCQIFKI